MRKIEVPDTVVYCSFWTGCFVFLLAFSHAYLLMGMGWWFSLLLRRIASGFFSWVAVSSFICTLDIFCADDGWRVNFELGLWALGSWPNDPAHTGAYKNGWEFTKTLLPPCSYKVSLWFMIKFIISRRYLQSPHSPYEGSILVSENAARFWWWSPRWEERISARAE